MGGEDVGPAGESKTPTATSGLVTKPWIIAVLP